MPQIIKQYSRVLSDTFSALGFKMLIENLFPDSIDCNIGRNNRELNAMEFRIV
ncbi:MAG TPA: hypothetical protein VJY41_12715 [Prolixibacteraceae bacterium]|nr:hypothetical protein [Prolixibacteraceae bacterium]